MCKVSEKINKSKLHEHFIKLLDQFTIEMDNNMNKTNRLLAKNNETTTTRRGDGGGWVVFFLYEPCNFIILLPYFIYFVWIVIFPLNYVVDVFFLSHKTWKFRKSFCPPKNIRVSLKPGGNSSKSHMCCE